MKKVRLDLEALAVETFEAQPDAAAPKRGTVEGYGYSDDGAEYTCWESCTCGWTCGGTCDPLDRSGCGGPCDGVITDVYYNSCVATCAFTLG